MNSKQLTAFNTVLKLLLFFSSLDNEHDYIEEALVEMALANDQFNYGNPEKGKAILMDVALKLENEINRVIQEDLSEL